MDRTAVAMPDAYFPTGLPAGDDRVLSCETMAKNSERPGRLKQLRMVMRFLRQQDPKALPIIIATALGVFVVFLIVAFVTGQLVSFIILGVLTGFTAGMFVFGRLAQRAQYRMLGEQPGGGAAILDGMRGNWSVTPSVAGNRSMDVVHRAVGRPGVILVGEGSPRGVGQLLGSEKKRIARVAAEVPIYDFHIGDGEGQVPLKKLNGRITRLPRNLRKREVQELNNRLKAMPSRTGMPGGPMPKNARMPRPPRNTRS